MGILDILKAKREEHTELKKIEDEAYLEAKAYADAERKRIKIEKAKERGIARASAGGKAGQILDSMSKMGEKYKENMEKNGGTFLKFGPNKK